MQQNLIKLQRVVVSLILYFLDHGWMVEKFGSERRAKRSTAFNFATGVQCNALGSEKDVSFSAVICRTINVNIYPL